MIHCKYQRNNNKTAYISIKLYCKQFNNAIQITYSLNFFCALTWVSFLAVLYRAPLLRQNKYTVEFLLFVVQSCVCMLGERERVLFFFFLCGVRWHYINENKSRNLCVPLQLIVMQLHCFEDQTALFYLVNSNAER